MNDVCVRAVGTVENRALSVVLESALRSGVDCIVTRNLKDYKKSPVPVYSPSAFLKQIEEGSEEE